MKDVRWIGSDDDLLALGPQGVMLVNGIGSTGRPAGRRTAFEKFKAAGFVFASVLHPSAVVASDAETGEGVQIMAGVVLQPGVRIGRNAIVNTGVIVDHDGNIGDHAHLAPGVCLAGSVTIGEGAHIGAGANVIQNIRVGGGAIVGAGAVVVSNIEAGMTVVGVPARVK